MKTHAEWQNQLERKEKKVKKKDVLGLLESRIISQDGVSNGPIAQRWWKIVGINYADRVVEISAKTQADCLNDLAILNGFTVEDD